MPDREKAIRILEGNYKNFVLRHNGELLTVNELIALLKAQDVMVMAGAELTDAELIEEIRKAPFVLKPTIDAIPVEWLREKMRGYASALKSTETAALVMVMQMWQKEQEGV